MSKGTIYLVENVENGKCYIGQTWYTLNQRKTTHQTSSKQNRSNSVFHKALQKYGFDSFVWSVLVSNVKSQERLDELEIEYIEIFDTSVPNGYNLKEGGRGGKLPPESIEIIRQKNKLVKRSEAFKERVSEVHTGKVNNRETRKKMSKSQKKRFAENPMSDETKKKISEVQKGKKLSPETRKKMSEGQRKRHAENPEIRKIVAEKSSKTQKGKKLTPEHRKALSEAQKAYRKKHPISEETRRKISETKMKYKAKQREESTEDNRS